MRPERYGFTVVDVKIEELNISRCYRYNGEAFVIAEIPFEQGEQLVNYYIGEQENFESDFDIDDCGPVQSKSCKGYSELLNKLNCHFLLLVWKSQDEERLLFFSDTSRVRALEFLDYLIADFGLVRGNASCASGQIASAIMSVQIAAVDLTDTMEYLLRMSVSYYEDCQWIEAVEYGELHQAEIEQMQKYHKKKIAWAYVKSTDVVPAGEQVCIKSLENESGLLLTADENTYIMIGCRGEVYDIIKSKFERTYEPTEEELDVFEQMLDFIPALEKVSDGDYISLDDVAHLCYPKQGMGIYSCELERRTKIFPANGSMEYFLGRPGDYMAVRVDDLSDIYIIQRDIFLQTYEVEE